MLLSTLDFGALFHIEKPVTELLLRGVIIYLGILFLMRILPRRTGGELAMMDLIFIFLIAEAASHALGEYSSVTEGFIMICTLMSINFLFNMLSYYVPAVEKLISAPKLQIVKNGEMLRRNMRREFITKEELMDHLREQGIDQLEKVKAAYVEGNGIITVIEKCDA